MSTERIFRDIAFFFGGALFCITIVYLIRSNDKAPPSTQPVAQAPPPIPANPAIPSKNQPKLAVIESPLEITPSVATQAATEPTKEFSDLIEDLEKSVVRLDVVTKKGAGIGSGFVVDREGTIVTNYHVVDGARRVTAVFTNGTKATVRGYLKLDSRKDLAIIKVDLDESRLFPMELSSNLPRKGSKVVALGCPTGLSFSTSDGMVSGLRDSDDLQGFSIRATLIQTTAPISPGNSGGPLVDLQGRVVGVNTLGSNSSKIQNINFAVSAIDLQYVLDSCGSQVTPW